MARYVDRYGFLMKLVNLGDFARIVVENFVQPITEKNRTKIKNQAKQENREFENGPLHNDLHNDVTWIKKYKNN